MEDVVPTAWEVRPSVLLERNKDVIQRVSSHAHRACSPAVQQLDVVMKAYALHSMRPRLAGGSPYQLRRAASCTFAARLLTAPQRITCVTVRRLRADDLILALMTAKGRPVQGLGPAQRGRRPRHGRHGCLPRGIRPPAAHPADRRNAARVRADRGAVLPGERVFALPCMPLQCEQRSSCNCTLSYSPCCCGGLFECNVCTGRWANSHVSSTDVKLDLHQGLLTSASPHDDSPCSTTIRWRTILRTISAQTLVTPH